MIRKIRKNLREVLLGALVLLVLVLAVEVHMLRSTITQHSHTDRADNINTVFDGFKDLVITLKKLEKSE